ncbi:serine/threonine protein kinase [Candidatus Uabimicrobium amorphum]|uniref:non-specific serine/threonine protein kinase n=1 Tax=Uabimicrobium amorphum TaxID=2596890 RepID=A0A5S9IU24_UABAM|nr:serine/threonine-protein kinase [Candidatus Uabimicrobium amorphum]BBM88153.1 protein kinase [Candidatus Uabimicrobium amorphum]
MQNLHFPGFEILKKLGEGGMGAVYKVREIQTARIFAIKTILSAKKDQTSYQRFLREAQAYASVQHPNIVRIYRIEPHQNNPFMVMQYVDGLPLDDYLKNKLSVTQKLQLFCDIAQAVHVLHKSNIIHRDLKPANIMIDTSGKPYIMDFGLIKAIDNRSKGLTKEGDVLGSPKYMSPEQVAGKKLDARSDVYSLGACFYEMLTARQLVEGDSAISIMFEISHGTITYPRKIDKTIPVEVEAICVKCLEKQTKERYPNVSSILKDIARYENGEKIKAKEVNFWYNCNKTLQRYTTEITVACVFLLCLFLIWGSWSQQRQILLKNLRDFSKKEAMETLNEERHKYTQKDIAIQVRYLHSLGNYAQALQILQDTKSNSTLQILKGKTFYKMLEYHKALAIYENIDKSEIESSEVKEYLELQILKVKFALQENFALEDKSIPIEQFCKNAKHKTIQVEAHYHLAQKYLEHFENYFYNFNINQTRGLPYLNSALKHFTQSQNKQKQVNRWVVDISLGIAACFLYKAQFDQKSNQKQLIAKAEKHIMSPQSENYDSHTQLRFHYTKALEHKLKGKTQQAIEQYNIAIKIDPSNSQLYAQRAHCYRLLQQHSLSEQDYLQVLDMEPHNFSAAYDLVNNIFEDTPIQSKFSTLQLLQKIAIRSFALSKSDLFTKDKEQLYKSSRFTKTQPYNSEQVQQFLKKLVDFEQIENPTLQKKLQNLVISGLECLGEFEKVYNDLQKKRDVLATDKQSPKSLREVIKKAQDKVIIRGHINMLIDLYLRKKQKINVVPNLPRTTKTLIRIINNNSIASQNPHHAAIIRYLIFKALVDIGSPFSADFLEGVIDKARSNRTTLSQTKAENLAMCMTLFYNNYWPYNFAKGRKLYEREVQRDAQLLLFALEKSSEIVRCFALNSMPIEYKTILMSTLRIGTKKETLYAAKRLWVHGHLEGGEYLCDFIRAPQEETLLAFAYQALWEAYNFGATKTSSLQKNKMRKICQQQLPHMIYTLQKCGDSLKNTLFTNLAVVASPEYDKNIVDYISSPTTDPYVRLRIISRLGQRKDISIIKQIVNETSIPLLFRMIAVVGAIDNDQNYKEMLDVLSILKKSQNPKVQNLLLIYSIMYSSNISRRNPLLKVSDTFKQQAYKSLASKNPQKQLVALVALYGEKIALKHMNKLKPLIASTSRKIQRYAAMNLGVQLIYLSNRHQYVQQICGDHIDKKNVREGIVLGYQRLFYESLKKRRNTNYLLASTTLKNFHMHFTHERNLDTGLRMTKPRQKERQWNYIRKWSKNLSPQVQQQILFWDGLLQNRMGLYQRALATFQSLQNDLQRNYWLAKTHYRKNRIKKSFACIEECLKISPWDMPSLRLKYFLMAKASVFQVKDIEKYMTASVYPSFEFAPKQYRYDVFYFASQRYRQKNISREEKKLYAEEMRGVIENLPMTRLSAITLRSRALIYLRQPYLTNQQDTNFINDCSKLAHDYLLYKNQFFHIPLKRISEFKKLHELFTKSELQQFLR